MPKFGKSKKPSVISLADRARDLGQWEVAVRYYKIALHRNPQNPPIWVQYGHVLKESGQLAEAERAYRTAIGYNGSAADPHLHLGHVLKIQGKKEEARTAYLCALALDPSLNDVVLEFAQLGWSNRHLSALRTMLGEDIGNSGMLGVNRTSVTHLLIPSEHKNAAEFAHSQPMLRGAPVEEMESGGEICGSTLEFAECEDVRLILESGLFDTAWYADKNRGVEGVAPDLIQHYLREGASEGYDPLPFFATDWYLANNPDVAAAGLNPLVHYLRSGAAEGRAPNPVLQSVFA